MFKIDKNKLALIWREVESNMGPDIIFDETSQSFHKTPNNRETVLREFCEVFDIFKFDLDDAQRNRVDAIIQLARIEGDSEFFKHLKSSLDSVVRMEDQAVIVRFFLAVSEMTNIHWFFNRMKAWMSTEEIQQ